VGREHDCLSPRGDGPHRRPEVSAAFDVERGGRLVEHEQVGIGDQGDREADALALTAGEFRGPAFAERRRPGEAKHLVHLERMRVERGDHSDELADAQELDQRTGLEHGADEAGLHRLGRRFPEDGHAARVGSRQAEHHVDRRRLAGAVRPENGHGLTRVDGDIHAAHRPDIPVGLCQTGEMYSSAVRLGDNHVGDLGMPAALREMNRLRFTRDSGQRWFGKPILPASSRPRGSRRFSQRRRRVCGG
jgi:hypothetical protein